MPDFNMICINMLKIIKNARSSPYVNHDRLQPDLNMIWHPVQLDKFIEERFKSLNRKQDILKETSPLLFCFLCSYQKQKKEKTISSLSHLTQKH